MDLRICSVHSMRRPSVGGKQKDAADFQRLLCWVAEDAEDPNNYRNAEVMKGFRKIRRNVLHVMGKVSYVGRFFMYVGRSILRTA